jgi:hypothetical protein
MNVMMSSSWSSAFALAIMAALPLNVLGADLMIGFGGIDNIKLGTPLSKIQPGPRTVAGVGVGDPVSKVREVYGRAVNDEPDFYDDRERYLTISSKDGRYSIRFMTSDGKISAIISGTAKSVQYIEGCL